MTIFEQLAADITQLLTSSRVSVTFSKNTLTPESRLHDLKNVLTSVFALRCPASVAESIRIDDEIYVYWKGRADGGDVPVFGEFFLRSVLVFALVNDLSETFTAKPYNAVDLRQTRVFDYYAHHGGPIHALLKVTARTVSDGVLVFNERDVFPTTLDYDGYLAALHRTKGFVFWQYLYCEQVRPETYELDAIRRGLEFVEREFPSEDYSDLWRRVDRLSAVP